LFQNTTPKIEDEIINYFVKNKYSAWVASAKGRFDLSVIMWIKDMSDFRIFWRKTLKKYRDYFQHEMFSIFFQTTSYHQSFLLEDTYDIKDRELYFIAGIEKEVEIDDIDFKILKALSRNARISSVELGNKLNLTALTISNRIKKLKDINIIQGFRVNIDFSKLGYKYYKVDINIGKFNIRDKIVSYVRLNPYLVYFDETAGSSDLELSFIVKNENHFHELMKDIIIKFPDTILNYQYYYVNKSHKLLFLPDE
jgi:Lrp/AsnC family leucine-responsive transcriptional regulator